MNYFLYVFLQASVLTDLRMEEEDSEPFGFFDLIKIGFFIFLLILIASFFDDKKKK